MRILLLLPVFFCSLTGFGQRFTLDHTRYGLGSTHDQEWDRLSVRDSALVLTYHIGSGEVSEDEYNTTRTVPKDTAFMAFFRPSSADSIRALLTGLENMSVSGSNFCVKSGSAIYIDISCYGKPTLFKLFNTYDSTALAITTILNGYLPEELQLYIPYDTWKIAQQCGNAVTNRRKPINEQYLPK